MWPNPQFPADLLTLTEEILNGKLHFLCNESDNDSIPKDSLTFKVKYKSARLKRWICSKFSAIFFKFDNENTKTLCEICSKVTTKTTDRRQWPRSGVLIVNFEQISPNVLVFPLLALSKLMSDGYVIHKVEGLNLLLILLLTLNTFGTFIWYFYRTIGIYWPFFLILDSVSHY